MATPPTAVEERPRVSGAQLALVIGGLVVLLAVVWFFFLRGGGEEPVAQVPTVPVATPTPEPEPTRDGKPRKGPIETFEVFAAKDPFEPLIDPEGAAGAAAAGGEAGAPAEEGAGETGGGGDGDAGGPTGGGGGGGGEQIGGRRVRLVDVFTENGNRRAQIQVDATVYTVDVGETFAENFRLLSTSGECATLLFGDDQFTLCEGEEILK